MKSPIVVSSCSMAHLQAVGFTLGAVLKVGSFTSICRASDSHRGNVSLTAKILSLSSTRPNVTYTQEAFISDCNISMSLKHDHLLEILDAHWLTSESGNRIAIFVMSDFAQGGDLLDLLEAQQGRPLSETRAGDFYQQFGGAVEYLHSEGLSHGNIKADKIVLNRDRTVCKLTDAGLSRAYFRYGSACRSLEKCFRPGIAYMAPELLSTRHLPSHDGSPSIDLQSSDIWSLGVVLFLLLHARLPFTDPTLHLWLASQLSGRYQCDKSLSPEGQHFLSQHLLAEGEFRPKMATLLEHPWLSDG